MLSNNNASASTSRYKEKPNYWPSFFPFLDKASFIVVGAVGGGAGARLRTTSVTVAPESRSTWTARAYSTFSRGTPLTDTIRSFTL